MMKILRAFTGVITRIEGWLLVLFLGIMVVLAFAQVVLRNVFGAGLMWGDSVVRQMVMWSAFMGAAVAAERDRHISIDALTRYLPRRVQRIARVVTHLFAGVVCLYLASAAYRLLLSEKESGGEIISQIPEWVGLIIIPLGYFLLAIHFLVNSLENGLSAVKRGAEEV